MSKIPAAQSLTDKIMDKPERITASPTAVHGNGRYFGWNDAKQRAGVGIVGIISICIEK
jgi:hypothetical protein